jgi:hypothetical protein
MAKDQAKTWLHELETLIALMGEVDHNQALEKAEAHSPTMRAQLEYYQHHPDERKSVFDKYARLREKRYARVEEAQGKTQEEWLTERSYQIAKDWLQDLDRRGRDKADARSVEPGFEGHGLQNSGPILQACSERPGK